MKKTYPLIVLFTLLMQYVFAQQPYVGEIRMFAGNFAPAGWAFCNGQLLSIAENEVLFNLIGTTYGGDGQEVFALPDLRGRVPIGANNNYVIGQTGGVESVSLTTNNVPPHSHNAQIVVSNTNATVNTPTASSNLATPGSLSGKTFLPATTYTTAAADVKIATVTTTNVGSSEPISIMKPYCGINYIISLFGIYPSQN